MKRYLFYAGFILLFLSACKKKDVSNDDTPTPETPGETVETGLITFDPAFPADDKPVTITFDAAKGNAGLKGFSGDVYFYSGVITDKSSGAGDWKYVKSASFNSPDAAAKMTALGNNKYSISFTPRTFYHVPSGEKILKLAMLFRSGDGSKVGRNKDNSDIFMPVYQTGTLNVRFTSPEFEPMFTPAPVVQVQAVGDELSVSAVASEAANLTLSLNGADFATASNSNTVSGKVKIGSAGNQEIKVTAVKDGLTAESTFNFIINGTVEIADLPSGAKDGVTFVNNGTSAIFNLYAPQKGSAYVIGDFNDWKTDQKYLMKRTPDGTRFWLQVDNLDPAKEYSYQYLVDNTLKIADPYAEKILDPQYDAAIPLSNYPSAKTYPTGKTTGIVSVMQGNPPAYNWKINSFTRPEKKNLVIYELHLRDFLASNNYNTLADTLNYLSQLGVNAVELMPVTEFEGNSSWGYNPDFYFTPDKYYGNRRMLKGFIDACHEKGIAVIFDMVLNHSFGSSPMVQLYFDNSTGKPAANNPWFNVDPTHPYNVGYDFNHESQATKYFVKNVLKFWVQQYKADGFRFDLSKGFTQKNSGTSDAAVGAWSAYDASRIAIWKDYNSFIKSVDPNNFYVILEHFAADQEEKELANAGMMLWNNLNYNFNEATMGYVGTSDISRAFYDKHGFDVPYNLVTYMESHDEERLMFKNLQYGNSSGSYSVKNLATALDRQKMAAAFLFAIPGPKMIWQFGELGYDVSIDQNGRTGEKPLHWDYYQDPQRRKLYDLYSRLIRLKIKNAVFSSADFKYSLNGAVKYIQLLSPDADVVVLGNFDVVSQDASIAFPSSGDWYEQLDGTTLNISQGTYNARLAPGEYHIYTTKKLQE